MCSFMQALIRPCPGETVPHKLEISGLHALAASLAPGDIWAIAPEIESSKMALTVTTYFNTAYSSFLTPGDHRCAAKNIVALLPP
jgi:hypothetical protein